MKSSRVITIFACIGVVFSLTQFERANAQDKTWGHPFCTTKGSLTAKTLTFNANDRTTLQGLRYSIVLSPPVRPIDPNACVRAAFLANGEAFFLGGEANGSVARFSMSPQNRNRLFLLETEPYPAAALKWRRDNPSAQTIFFPPKDLMYALTSFSLDSKEVSIVRYYDQIPDDHELVQTMCDALSGAIKPVFKLGPESGIPVLHSIPQTTPVIHADCRAKFTADQQ
jgi:hypothetical protein